MAEVFRIFPDNAPLQDALRHAALRNELLLMHQSGSIVAAPRPLHGFRLCRGVKAAAQETHSPEAA